MLMGRVVGNVWATREEASFEERACLVLVERHVAEPCEKRWRALAQRSSVTVTLK